MASTLGFRAQLAAFRDKTTHAATDVFVGVVQEVQRSIQEGSELTGAPGQPVDTEHLKASWYTRFESPTEALVATNTAYAPYIEAGGNSHGDFTLRSEVGGFFSVALTRAGFDRIVDHVAAQVAAGRQGFINEASGYAGEDGG